jgi:hypothetical protein
MNSGLPSAPFEIINTQVHPTATPVSAFEDSRERKSVEGFWGSIATTRILGSVGKPLLEFTQLPPPFVLL